MSSTQQDNAITDMFGLYENAIEQHRAQVSYDQFLMSIYKFLDEDNKQDSLPCSPTSSSLTICNNKKTIFIQ